MPSNAHSVARTLPTGPQADTITVAETLSLLDNDFSSFAKAFANDEYMVWVGSGISLDAVPGLKVVIRRILDRLHAQVDWQDPGCPFKTAIVEVLQMAVQDEDEMEQIDLQSSPETWPNIKKIVKTLVNSYAAVLAVEVGGKENDYILWEVLDVCATYGDPILAPTVEHICLAILARECVVSIIASTNWDGLIEKAADNIGNGAGFLKTCVKPADLRGPPHPSTLIKPHGCAVKARHDPAEYRRYLVSRQSQIDAWDGNPNTAPLMHKLVSTLQSKQALVIGLSLQDGNLRAVFNRASNFLNWNWPTEPPACVIGCQDIEQGQRSILQNIYGSDYNQTTRDAISASARLPAYAKQLLVSLVVNVQEKKYAKLAAKYAGLHGLQLNFVHAGLQALRDACVVGVDASKSAIFIDNFMAQSTKMLTVFLDGRLPPPDSGYRPLTFCPVDAIDLDTHLVSTGLPGLAATLGLIGAGIKERSWTIVQAASVSINTVRVISGDLSADLVLVNNDTTKARILNSDAELPTNSVFVHADEIAPALQRGYDPQIGRNGHVSPRSVNLNEIFAQGIMGEDLVQHFQEEIF